MKRKKLLWMTLISIFILSSIRINYASPTTSLSVDPQNIIDTNLGPDSTFTINITVTNVVDLYGYEFKLGYETAVLTATNIDVGPFLLPDYFEWATEINDAEGWLYYSVTQDFAEWEGEDGSGVVAKITFSVDHYGESVLNLYETVLGDSYLLPISHEAIDGYFRNVDPEQIPVASFTYTPEFPIEREDVTFNASLSTPDGGTIITYKWDFGDGNAVSEADPIATHNYTLRGTYTVKLTVIDNDDIVDTVKHDLTVLAHDIAVVGVVPFYYHVWIGETVNVTVSMRNQGHFTETFNVTTYYNESIIEMQTDVSLSAGSYTQLRFAWDTTGVPIGNYTISATASTVPGETDTDDNTKVDDIALVTILGDVDGDVDVDASDLFDLNKAYGSKFTDPNWDPYCDFNRDDKVDASDLFDLSKNYGKSYP